MPVRLAISTILSCIAALSPPSSAKPEEMITHKDTIWGPAIALLAVAVANFGATFMRRYAGGRLSLDVQHDLRTEMLEARSRLDGARQDEIHTGQLISRSISDINMIQSLLSFLPITLGSALLFVASIIIMLFLSPLLTLVAPAAFHRWNSRASGSVCAAASPECRWR